VEMEVTANLVRKYLVTCNYKLSQPI
jgi:hypothetical protein